MSLELFLCALFISAMDNTLIFDFGHGVDTPGKRSPDATKGLVNSPLYFREYKYAREVGHVIADYLQQWFDIKILVPEENDIPLATRVKRCNDIVRSSNNPCYLISIHNNAAGRGEWMSARGWSVWVSKKASQKSKDLANSLYDAVAELGYKARQPHRNQKYWEENFYITTHSNCPAVLTENFFQDNKEDVAFLLSEEGRNAVANIHVVGIMKYFNLPYTLIKG